MELVGEDGIALELTEGYPLVLGRVAGLSHHDGSVSRHQVVIELLRPRSRKGKEIVGQSPDLKLQVQVVGRNPVCVVNRVIEAKSNPQVKFLSNGQKDWLNAGDKISLSIKRPFFYELRFEGQSSPSSGKAILNTQADFNGVESAPDGRNGEYAKFVSMDEEEGIAEAVARRQRRKLEREWGTERRSLSKQHQTVNVGPKEGIPEKTDFPNVASHKERSVLKTAVRREENGEKASKKQEEEQHSPRSGGSNSIDPLTEFGFIVEGSEFSAYEKRSKKNKSLWTSEIGESKGVEDDSSGDEMTRRRDGSKDRTVVKKSHTSDEEDEWVGDEEEQDRLKTVAQKKAHKRLVTRTTGPKSTSSRSKSPSIKPAEWTQDEAGSLDDFIVDDEDSVEDNEEEEHDLGASKIGQILKLECKYGINCYRKNVEHRAQFYHPSS